MAKPPYAPFIWLSLLLIPPLYLTFKKKKQNKQLPPTPSTLPILGNWHQLGQLIHQSYCQLSKKYGPVMLLRLGQIPVLVVSSAEAASNVLKVNDLSCCSRPYLAGADRLSYNFLDVALAPYGDHWRHMKKLIVLNLFSLKRVQSFQFLREEEVELLVNSISATETPIDLTEKLFALVANITYRMSFGVDRGTNLDRDKFHQVVHETHAVAGSFSMAELFPFAGWIIDRITGNHAETIRAFHELDSFFEHAINDHLKPGRKKERDDIIDVLLRVKEEQAQLGTADFTKNNIKAVLMNLLSPGTDTAAITLNWAMAELVRNPRVLGKVQDEVRKHVGNKGKVSESDLDKLQYLKMVIKETFRMHPVGPLLLPRETISHCKINGYDVDPKTMIQVNVWAIGRDPTYWKEPEKLYPERFADSSIDYRGQNFELLPFGAGRRMCPGIHMATITIEYVLANLLYLFDWKFPEGMRKEDMNMEEKVGVSLAIIDKKTPLILVPIKHLQ
ncbi:cytochrome P450 71B36-like [Euphorbia lathyris]|uniref:cytochrome P450 71B36-like n=1 Tax=Euphorbia lathyris TaxID=212925 RepID=UPI00331359E8